MKLLVERERDGFEGIKIGESLVSETLIPRSYNDPEVELTYLDCPGFQDNRGVETNILNAFYIQRACEMAEGAVFCLVF